MDLVFDIETDDLKATKIHCIVAQDIDSGEIFKFTPKNLEEGYNFLTTADKLIGHNIIGFDIPMVEKFGKVDLSKIPVIDTLVLSRLFNPTREGGHSLERWGYKLGTNKIEFEDFKNYSKTMLDYCVRDVQLNAMLFKALRQESKGFSKQSIELEQQVAKIMKKQEVDGFKLDEKKSLLLLAELREKKKIIEEEVQETFKPITEEIKIEPLFLQTGKMAKKGFNTTTRKNTILTEEEYKKLDSGASVVTRYLTTEFNLGSRQQIGERLIEAGWKPERLTPTGQPVADEKTLSKIKHIHEAKLISEFLLLQKRIAQVSSWVDAIEKDGRVHGFVIPNGAITGRMTHRSPNMAQVPAVSSSYGKECRSCWIVEEGNVLVGIDASGLELRMLAHYLNDEEFTYEITNGDIHTANQRLANLKSRDKAKTFIYALLYGARDKKLGKVVGGTEADGRRARQHFFDNKPAFRLLRDRVERASKKGYLKGLDGRKIYIRTAHASLNSLLQGAGAVIMKKALCLLDNYIRDNNLEAKFVANIHDEWQIEAESTKENATAVGEFGIKAIQEAGEHFVLRCPLTGEYKIGEDWSETH